MKIPLRNLDPDELEKLYNTPANRRLKRIAICVIALAITLLLSTIFLLDHVTWRIIAILRGTAGLLALLFVILLTILLYRVNRAALTPPRK